MRGWLIWIALGAGMCAAAAQEEGPILKPKRPPATLVVTCDLACTWTLDGKARGAIATGASGSSLVTIGPHVLSVVTEDGLDKVNVAMEIKAPGQTLQRVDLQPVRDARLKAAYEAEEARAKYEKEGHEAVLKTEQEAKERRAREQATAHYDKGAQYWNLGAAILATPEFEQACDGGNMDGCFELGYAYDVGKGVSQDYGKARELYGMACDANKIGACFNLGILYDSGNGGAKDYVQARAMYQKACDGGDSGSCNNLGSLYDAGHGVTQDYAQARVLFEKACTGGDMTGCGNLGHAFRYGKGTAVNLEQARAFYKKACDGGSASGCSNLKEVQ